MAAKKQTPRPHTGAHVLADAPAGAWVAAAAERPGTVAPSSAALPQEVTRGDWTWLILALTMFFAPAAGVPSEDMLQDTLKSAIVCFAALGAAALLFWRQRDRHEGLRWHAVLWLPLLLMAYALGSMAWSHTYLAGVEAIRWFVFALLAWLGLNTLTRERLPLLAEGIHWGAVVASLWTALQYWGEFSLFPQGPNPASTFVNRNFFAEFAACTVPFSFLLLAQARERTQIVLMALGMAFVWVAIFMTGTRSALIALGIEMLVVLPAIAWIFRRQLALSQWDASRRLLGLAVVAATVLGLGSLPTGNAKIAAEERGLTPIARASNRAAAISPRDDSLGVRMVMWRATLNILEQRPLEGVGAGAWESDIPLYQAAGSQLETDYYVHNEFLQLVAEYGVVGWIFLLLLFAYLLKAAWRTLRASGEAALAEAPQRAVLLCALLALFIVSNVGFPWRMATTGALFALCLGALAASDARLGLVGRWQAARLRWSPALARGVTVATLACLLLAGYITRQAVLSERKIIQATRMALTISASGNPQDPRWNAYKNTMLQLIAEGISINRHYRKITPMVADELARWGDWQIATWIWESVLSSRPYVVAMLTNVARGHTAMGHFDEAQAYLARAMAIRPDAPAVRSLEVVLLARQGQPDKALAAAKRALDAGIVDFDLVNAAFALAWRASDYDTALRAMNLRLNHFPAQRVESYLQLGHFWDQGPHDLSEALKAYRRALALVPPQQQAALQRQIPSAYWPQLGLSAPRP